jgi:hypothetical protein
VAAFCKPVSGKHNNNQARLFALFDWKRKLIEHIVNNKREFSYYQIWGEKMDPRSIGYSNLKTAKCIERDKECVG